MNSMKYLEAERSKLLKISLNHGIESKEALKQSQQLDELIWEYQKKHMLEKQPAISS